VVPGASVAAPARPPGDNVPAMSGALRAARGWGPAKPERTLRFRHTPPDRGDGLVLLGAMRAEIARLYQGLDLDAPAMPRAGPAELSPPRGAFVVGYMQQTPVCCGGIKRLDAHSCELKRIYVAEGCRGRGVARALLEELESVARGLGYSVARLDTGPRQGHARSLFESAGYRPVADFNGNPIATFWGEKRL